MAFRNVVMDIEKGTHMLFLPFPIEKETTNCTMLALCINSLDLGVNMKLQLISIEIKEFNIH